MNTHHRRSDASVDLLIETHDLRRRAGQMIQVARDVPAPEELGVDMIGVPEGSPIGLDLRLESVIEGVLVTGTATTTLVGECSRCLNPIEETTSFDLQELHFYPDREAEEDAYRVSDEETVDLEPVLREAVVLNLPFRPLCMPDCAGLCPECGVNLNDHPDHEHEERIDPRWAALRDLGTGES
ncbi:YceD family protein [Acidipropionibacterium acidipropionici]|uniref:YceD family protein n=1 Tax=Acidipropionibacterium acidipropionici TaxID=1748 RepID=UPI00041FF0CE|nr:DUF177 domain-containing protein [Acidipropionibacterium acidipropionici]ALN15723.1 metal-binding protein [Acidipropionibacterium acidipropionici]APZ08533.1 metal-binding protein [Acidipropionibacterium acidipropionici]